MVFEYKVKYNGKYYKAGENVPMEDEPTKVEPKEEVTPIEKAMEAFEQKAIETGRKGRPKKTKE